MRMSIEEMERRLTYRQLCEVMSSENMYFTWMSVKHSPSYEEALVHYFTKTGPHPLIIEFEVEDDRTATLSHAA